MSASVVLVLFMLLGFLFSATFSQASEERSAVQQLRMDSVVHKHQRDVITPMTATPLTNPVINPYTTNPATNTYTDPNLGNPTSSSPSPSLGQSWCIANPSASESALQVALDYACGYGGADCSAIQQAGSCFDPDTVRDHASYAFNSYYQKNPVPTSCDFSGTAMITNTDPSISTCQYPSSSTSSSTLNTTLPTGSTVFGSSPPDYTNSKSSLIKKPTSSALLCLVISLVYLEVYK